MDTTRSLFEALKERAPGTLGSSQRESVGIPITFTRLATWPRKWKYRISIAAQITIPHYYLYHITASLLPFSPMLQGDRAPRCL